MKLLTCSTKIIISIDTVQTDLFAPAEMYCGFETSPWQRVQDPKIHFTKEKWCGKKSSKHI